MSDCGHVETRKWLKLAPTWRRDEDALLTGPIAKLAYRRVVNLGFNVYKHVICSGQVCRYFSLHQPGIISVAP